MQDLYGVTIKGDPLTEESEYAQVANRLNTTKTGPVDLGIADVQFNKDKELFAVKVNSQIKKQGIATSHLAEQFINELPLDEQEHATIVKTTFDGKEILHT